MKKIVILLLITLPLLLQSCLKDQKDFFPDTPSDRTDAFAQDVKTVLTGAQNGWKMDIYPSLIYGGYTLLLKFSDTNVTAGSELAAAAYRESSLYQISKSSGVILSFDTYNSLIHYFSGPNKNLGAIDKGLGGDYDFIVLEATPSLITLQGAKTGNTIYMTPVASGADWTQLLTSYQTAAKNYKSKFNMFKYQVNGKTFDVTNTNRMLTVNLPQDDGSMKQTTASYIFTLTGIKFYNPLTLEGDSVREMNYKTDGTTPYFEDSAGSGARLVVVFPPLSGQFTADNWYFAYSGMGSTSKLYWNYVKVNGLDPIGQTMYYAYMGTSSSGFYGFSFAATDGTYAYPGTLIYKVTPVSDTEVNFVFTLTVADNGLWYYNNAKFAYFPTVLGTSTGKIFAMTSDNDNNPTWIKLTDKSDPNNYYTLYKTVIYYPYTK